MMKPSFLTIGERYLGYPFHYHHCERDDRRPDPKDGFDCSGFVRFVLNEAGYQLPPEIIDARNLFDFVGTPLTAEEARPGDLVFFTQWGTTPSHIAFAAGENRVLHCSSRVPGVGYSELEQVFSYCPRAIDPDIPTRYPKK